jgi:hypothetical protein
VVRRSLLVCAAAVVAALPALVGAASATAAAPRIVTSLTSGHCLTGARGVVTGVAAPNGTFRLEISDDAVILEEYTRDIGTDVWMRDSNGNPKLVGRTGSSLCVGPQGNVYLRAYNGTTIWQTHTSGTGTHDRLIVTSSGDVEERTSANKIVWRSHTTNVVLDRGQRLASGARLVQRWDDRLGAPVSYLTMTRGGDLELAVGAKVFWRSRTSVRGSYAYLASGGNLMVYSPGGRLLWQSGSGGHHGDMWLDFGCGDLAIHLDTGKTFTVIYQTPIHPNINC